MADNFDIQIKVKALLVKLNSSFYTQEFPGLFTPEQTFYAIPPEDKSSYVYTCVLASKNTRNVIVAAPVHEINFTIVEKLKLRTFFTWHGPLIDQKNIRIQNIDFNKRPIRVRFEKSSKRKRKLKN